MRKLMWFSLGFVLATIIGIYYLQGTWYFLASGIAALLLGALIFFLNRSVKVRITAMVILGCVVGFVWMTVFDYAYLSVARAADEEKIMLTITATDYSEETEYGTSVDGIGRLNNRSYKMRIYLPKGVELEPGDTITGRFSLRCTLERCSGESQYSFSHGIFLSARMTRLPVIDEAEKLPWYGYPAAVRQNLAQLIYSSFPDDTAGFALALLIGDASGIDYETDTAFKVSGISHIIAVSGFHVTVLFALVYVILGKNRILSAILGLPLLFFFAAVAGFSASVTRACLMHSLMIIGLLIDKEYDPLTLLGFAALCMLALNPWTVANVSFQLSVLCMVGILTISDPIKKWILDRLPLSRCNKKMKKWAGALAASIAMSIGATVFVTPLCAYYFGMVSLVGVLTNLLTLWVISIVFYGIIAVCLISIVWIPLGAFLATIISLPIRYVLAVSKILADFPLAAVYTNSAFIVIWLIFAYFVLLVNCFAKKKKPLESICYVVIGLCIALMASWTLPLQDECRVTVLDVGQGQCVLLQAEGKTYMVDCGGDMDEESATSAANILLSQGVFRLDGLILTHFDRDHAGGVPYFLSRIPVERLYYPQSVDGGEVLLTAASKDVPAHLVNQMMGISFGNANVTLVPSKNVLTGNDASLCVLFQTENCDILITGDRSAAGERELMRQVDLPELEVLIVSHHGSKYSTGNALLQKTRPEVAIISVGIDNLYGHPAKETLNRLQESGCIVYRTDQHGTVVYRR